MTKLYIVHNVGKKVASLKHSLKQGKTKTFIHENQTEGTRKASRRTETGTQVTRLFSKEQKT